MYNLSIEAVSWHLSIWQTRRRRTQMLLNNIWLICKRITLNEKFIDLGRSLFNRYGRCYRFSLYGCPQYRNRCKKIIWKQTKYFKRFPNPTNNPSRLRRSGFRLSTDSGIRCRHKREPQTAKFGGGNKRKRDYHEKFNQIGSRLPDWHVRSDRQRDDRRQKHRRSRQIISRPDDILD